LLTVNSNELDQKDQRKRKRKQKEKKEGNHLLPSLSSQHYQQEGDESCHFFPFCNTTIKEGNGNLVLLPSSLQQNHKRR
jgi:hypothetical protein